MWGEPRRNFELNGLQAGDYPQRPAIDPAGCQMPVRCSTNTARSGSSRCWRISAAVAEFADAGDGAHPHIGYDNAAKVAKKAHKEGSTLKGSGGVPDY